MQKRNPIVLFFCKFALLYILLALPWPGWDRIYGVCFRVIGRAVYAGGSGRRDLSFETATDTVHPYYTRVVIINTDMIHADGSGPVRNLDLDAIAFGWKPIALLIALIVATPVSWRRRGRALFRGLLCINIFILLFLGFCIWNESTEISLVILSPFWKNCAEGLRALLVSLNPMVLPVIVWVLVTFRREDRFGPVGLALLGPAARQHQ